MRIVKLLPTAGFKRRILYFRLCLKIVSSGAEGTGHLREKRTPAAQPSTTGLYFKIQAEYCRIFADNNRVNIWRLFNSFESDIFLNIVFLRDLIFWSKGGLFDEIF